MSDFNDTLDNLFAGDITSDGAPRVQPPAAYTPLTETFKEGCKKCGGSGRFRSWSGRTVGQCFACKGKGSKTFKTSPETRTKQREANRVHRVRRAAEAEQAQIAGFKQEKAAVWAWIERKTARGNEFASSLMGKLNQYGHLTDGQIAAVEKAIAKDEAWAAERQARDNTAPVTSSEGVDRLKAAFDTAIANAAERGLKMAPKLTIGGMVISPAKANSANPGALYVKDGSTYLGKITNGRFFAARECSGEQQAKVLKFVADPKAAAEAYGQTTGTCCVCNATLTSEWKFRGIGPICSQRWGWG